MKFGASAFNVAHPARGAVSEDFNRTERLNRRVETLISICKSVQNSPTSSPAFSQLGQDALDPVEPANPWALDLDLATVKADLALGPPPAVRLAHTWELRSTWYASSWRCFPFVESAPRA